jgi:hypothetical protein
MFRIAEDPSSVSLVQCLAKNYRNDSIVSVDMDKVGVMAAYCDRCVCVCVCVCVCADHCIGRHSELHTRTHTHTQRSQYAAITPTLSISTDTIESFL